MHALWRVLGWYLPAAQKLEAADPAGHDDPAGHPLVAADPVGQ
jgi:hypothetical protein